MLLLDGGQCGMTAKAFLDMIQFPQKPIVQHLNAVVRVLVVVVQPKNIMKKILIPYQREEFIKLCDKHHKEESSGNFWLTFGESSKYGQSEMSIDLCDECAEHLMQYLKIEFKDRAKLTNSIL